MNIRYMKKVENLLNNILNHQVANRSCKKDAFYRCYTYDHGKWPDWVKKAEKMRLEFHRILLMKRDKHGKRASAPYKFTIRWKERGRWKYSVCGFRTKAQAADHAAAIGAALGEIIPINRRPSKG